MLTQREAPDKLDVTTLCDAVFAKLKEEILSGTLKPGRRLEQTELAARFGISRMPVRDALRKLESEGLVTVYPGRGAVVSVLDLQEMQEIYSIREVLDALAARMAAPHVTDEDLAALTRMVEQMEEASRQGDVALWLRLDPRFHQMSYQRCGSPRLLKLLAGFWNTTHQFRRAYVMLPGRIACAEEMHRRLLAAMAARDGELFARLTAEHIRESVRGIMEVQPRP